MPGARVRPRRLSSVDVKMTDVNLEISELYVSSRCSLAATPRSAREAGR